MKPTVIDEIADERLRQIGAEGYSPNHDDQHDFEELAQAAACYALRACKRHELAHDLWPWADASWKPKDTRRDLIRAAALIVAEIERLDRRAANGKAAP